MAAGGKLNFDKLDHVVALALNNAGTAVAILRKNWIMGYIEYKGVEHKAVYCGKVTPAPRLVFSPDDRFLFVIDGSDAILLQTSDMTLVDAWDTTVDDVSVTFSSDSALAASTGRGALEVCIRRLLDDDNSYMNTEPKCPVFDIAFVEDDELVVLGAVKTKGALATRLHMARSGVKHRVPASNKMLYLGNNRLFLYRYGRDLYHLKGCVFDLGLAKVVQRNLEMVCAPCNRLTTDGVAVYGVCGGDLWTLWLPTGQLRVRHFAPLNTPINTLASYVPRAARVAYVLPDNKEVYLGPPPFSCFPGSHEYRLLNLWLLAAGVPHLLGRHELF